MGIVFVFIVSRDSPFLFSIVMALSYSFPMFSYAPFLSPIVIIIAAF